MKLVLLYGPPGTGKLTVGKELARQTGFRLFHNHLTVDLAQSLFDFGSAAYLEYVRHLRLEAFRWASQAGVNLVFTFWYSNQSHESLQRYRQVIEQNGGEVLPIKLFCRPDILRQRVLGQERQGWKISNHEDLQAALENTDLEYVVPGTRLELDNSDLAPEAAAARIASVLGLGVLP